MRRIGISVYLDQEATADTIAYIKLAAHYGFKRIFTCLISEANRPFADVIESFKQITAVARAEQMEIIADVEPAVFERYHLSWEDLSTFQKLGLTGIRLDVGYTGLEESLMTFNKNNIKIELNMSNDTKNLENILSYRPNLENLCGCHNFYPHRHTGLGEAYFLACSRQFKQANLPTAAFVNASSATHGPWPVSEGLCSLEMHRNLPISVQAKHLFATGLIDDVIIANAFASESELQELAQVEREVLVLRAAPCADMLPQEKKILFDELHFCRGDVSDYVIRSTQPRVKYKGTAFPAHNLPKTFQKGDIIIESSLYKRYAGELQLVKQPLENSGKSNLVGKVVPEEIFLLDMIEPWGKFKFTGSEK